MEISDFNIADQDGKIVSIVQPQGINELGQKYYKCDWLSNEVWKHGFVCMSEVSWRTCAYVARYVKKKDKGLIQDSLHERYEEPEYSVMSRNPGIGMYYPVDHPDCFEKSKFYFPDQEGCVTVNLPAALLRYLYMNDRKLYNELKENRAKFARDAEINKIWQTDLTSMEMGEISENQIIQSEKVLDYYRSL